MGIAGGPGKAYEECGIVTKNICEDVPKNKDVTAEIETCIQTPKEVRKWMLFKLYRTDFFRFVKLRTENQQNILVRG